MGGGGLLSRCLVAMDTLSRGGPVGSTVADAPTERCGCMYIATDIG